SSDMCPTPGSAISSARGCPICRSAATYARAWAIGTTSSSSPWMRRCGGESGPTCQRGARETRQVHAPCGRAAKEGVAQPGDVVTERNLLDGVPVDQEVDRRRDGHHRLDTAVLFRIAALPFQLRHASGDGGERGEMRSG